MNCLNCNEDFQIKENHAQNKKRKFCSNSCSASFNNKIRYKKIILSDDDRKECRLCREIKSLSEFYKRKNSIDGYRNECKKCQQLSKNKKETSKIYYQNNKENIKEAVKFYYRENLEKIKIKKKEYQNNNKEQRNEYLRNRYNTDILYHISTNVRSSILKAFKRGGYIKNSKTFNILQCSFEYLKIHIESQFKEGMSWNNHGEWHIDHKIPLSWAINEEHLKELCNYKNLQPLWAYENLSKNNYYSN